MAAAGVTSGLYRKGAKNWPRFVLGFIWPIAFGLWLADRIEEL